MVVELHLNCGDHASGNLNARIAELKKRDVRVALDAKVQGIQFLRGVAGRASFVLPAYYEQLAASIALPQLGIAYSRRVQATNTEFSSILALSLICRSVFDDAASGLTGKNFARSTDDVLSLVAKFWSEKGKRPASDAFKALKLLRALFQRCARPRRLLLDAPSLLERRIGLLKHHADREAAHISLEPFLFHVLDLIHIVAVITIIGAIIVEFDDPARGTEYFNEIDRAAWEAVQRAVPELPGNRLFHTFNVHEQGRLYWSVEEVSGLNMLLDQLPAAIGYWDGGPASGEEVSDGGMRGLS